MRVDILESAVLCSDGFYEPVLMKVDPNVMTFQPDFAYSYYRFYGDIVRIRLAMLMV